MRGHQIVAGVAAVICAAAVHSMATVVASDSFSLNGSTRVAGTAVKNLPTEMGGKTWTADTGVNLGATGSDGYVVFPATLNNGSASVALFTTAPTTDQATLSVTASGLTTTALGGQWFGLGFADSSTRVPGANNRLWLEVRTGTVTLHDDSVAAKTAKTAATVTLNSGNNTFGLIYNPVGNSASVTVNGAAVPAYTNVALTNWTAADLKAAGFTTNGTSTTGTARPGDQLVTDFSVTVPEPATIGLSAVGLAGLSMRRRQRA